MADYTIVKTGVIGEESYVIVEYTMPVAATIDVITGLKTITFINAQFKTAQRGIVARATTAGTVTVTGTNADVGRLMVFGRTY